MKKDFREEFREWYLFIYLSPHLFDKRVLNNHHLPGTVGP